MTEQQPPPRRAPFHREPIGGKDHAVTPQYTLDGLALRLSTVLELDAPFAIGDWLVHAGDAYFHRNSVEGPGGVPFGFAAFERAMQMDSAARRASVAALRQLRESYSDLDLFCAHDAREYAALAGA